MTTESTGSLQIELNNATYCLEFFRRGDRYAHRVVKYGDSVETMILQSIEGSAQQDWPPSPPLQDISIELINDQDAGLLVGMAGASHWSMSVTQTSIDERIGWAFDVACRIKKQPSDWIGSCYEVYFRDDIEIRPVEVLRRFI